MENEGVLTVVTVENQVNGSEISPPFSLSKCQYLPSSTSSLRIQAVSTDQVKEAEQEELKEEVKGEDQSADVIQPNQKVTLINSATNALVFG